MKTKEVVEPNNSQADLSIERFYNSEAKSMAERHEKKGIHQTAMKQIVDILDSGSQNVIDVGSGPGSLLLELLKHGINKVTGIDLSPEMNKIAKVRIEESGFSQEQFNLIDGSFLQLEPQNFDAVSLHRVLCCHPDKDGMLKKTVEMDPKVISLTIPRTWLFMRFLLAIFGVFAKMNSSFRPYIHSQKFIDQELSELGYEVISRKKTWGWVQSTYQKKSIIG